MLGIDQAMKAIKGLITELGTLNANMELLQFQVQQLVSVLKDLRAMAAPVLGWRVTDEDG